MPANFFKTAFLNCFFEENMSTLNIRHFLDSLFIGQTLNFEKNFEKTDSLFTAPKKHSQKYF